MITLLLFKRYQRSYLLSHDVIDLLSMHSLMQVDEDGLLDIYYVTGLALLLSRHMSKVFSLNNLMYHLQSDFFR